MLLYFPGILQVGEFEGFDLAGQQCANFSPERGDRLRRPLRCDQRQLKFGGGSRRIDGPFELPFGLGYGNLIALVIDGVNIG